MSARPTFVHWFYPFVLGAVAVEIAWYLLVRRRRYPWQEMFASLGVQAMRLPAKLAAQVTVARVAYFIWSHRVMTVPLDTAWGLLLLLLSEEFAYYWMHRAGHEVRWLWASHVVHHTPAHIYLANALRVGATEFLSGNWLFYLPLYGLGFKPAAVSGTLAVNLFYQFWLHTDLVGRLGPVEWIFNTPSHHRVHHASNSEYLDRNYGGILIVWDRLFGTFAEERPQTQIVYGLVHPIGSFNPIRIAFHEWAAIIRDVRDARSRQARLTLLFGRPGAEVADAAGGRAAQARPVAAE